MEIPRFTLGVGDRFGHQGKAQLAAFLMGKDKGADVYPVWNKSNREHKIIGTRPESLRQEADAAVKALSWKGAYFVDADHIQLATVDGFIPSADFFTIDVADNIGQKPDRADLAAFVEKQTKLFAGKLKIAGIDEPFEVTKGLIEASAMKYLNPIREAGRIYRRIETEKGKGNFVTEISMDETDKPQSPLELFFILAAAADEKIPLQTIAPKFSGRFNKGVDFVGDLSIFEKEFNDDLCVISFVVKELGLPKSLKLSVHSGSDKFSLYKPIRKAVAKWGSGLHLKTAGTTWLEELIGLAASGKAGLEMAKGVYGQALRRYDELAAPYASVIDIDPKKLPEVAAVSRWGSEEFVHALTHDEESPLYNPSLRQLLHVGYKVAAELGGVFTRALVEYEDVIGQRVTHNLFARHLKPLFLE